MFGKKKDEAPSGFTPAQKKDQNALSKQLRDNRHALDKNGNLKKKP